MDLGSDACIVGWSMRREPFFFFAAFDLVAATHQQIQKK
jgi:hypothetical protein